MTPPPSILRHYIRYFNASLLVVVAGMISYPILVRLLSEVEYGYFGYYEMVATLWIALLKFGTQHSIFRLYSSHCLGLPEARQRRFYTTLLLAPSCISTFVCGAAIAIAALVHAARPYHDFPYLWVVLLTGQFMVLASFVENLLRAREQSRLAATLQVVARYLMLALTLVAVFFVARTALAVFHARLIASAAMVCVLFAWLTRNARFGRDAFDPALFRESLRYGLPLVLGEVSMVLLAFGDRALIRPLLGEAQLGVYTIGYGLAGYIGLFLYTTVLSSFQPTINRLYEQEGEEAARLAQTRAVRALLAIAMPIAVGLWWVGTDFLQIVAGTGKDASGAVFALIGINYLLMSLFGVMNHGLALDKRTGAISTVTIAAALLNLALNWWWIPHFGIMGSVYATLVAYSLNGLVQFALVRRELRPLPAPMAIARPVALGATMWGVAWATGLFGLEGHFARLGAMAGIFAAVYVIPLAVWDQTIREELTRWLARSPRP